MKLKIKNGHFEFLISVCVPLLLLGACTSSPSSPVLSYRLVREDLDLGEYSQSIDSNTLITVNRSSGGVQGLVAVHLKNDEIDVLDSNAKEARDIHALRVDSHLIIFYRIDHDLYLFIDGKVEKLSTRGKRARTLNIDADGNWVVTYDETSTHPYSARWLRGPLNANFSVSASGDLPGSPRAGLSATSGKILWILDTPQGLSTLEFSDSASSPVKLLSPNLHSDYVAARMYEQDKQLGIFAFDNELGTLSAFFCAEKSTDCTESLVDGTPYSTLRGHDVLALENDGKPYLIYADVRALKLRRAWMKNKDFKKPDWASEQFPIEGAVGFYAQFLESKKGSQTLSIHNFRSSHPGQIQTFEDLAVMEIRNP